MKWCRLYAEFATDPKVQSMPEDMQRRLVMLFCLHAKGDMPGIKPEEIRYAFRINSRSFLKTFQIFFEKGFIDENWMLKNWDKRQFKSDDISMRVRKFRGGRKNSKMKRYSNVTCNDIVTPPDTDTDTDTEIKPKTSSASDDAVHAQESLITRRKRKLNGKRYQSFMRFWEAFDYKKDRAQAADAWLDIQQLTNAMVAQIVAAAEVEAKNRPDLIARGRTPIYAQGWITARRWEDEPYEAKEDYSWLEGGDNDSTRIQ